MPWPTISTLPSSAAYDIQHLYPQEYAIAKQGLHALCRSLAVDLPDTEIVSIAMHIITAENEVEDMHSTILTAKVISELSAIVEHGMEIQLTVLYASAVSGTAHDARQSARCR